jgi:hypothetical protein
MIAVWKAAGGACVVLARGIWMAAAAAFVTEYDPVWQTRAGFTFLAFFLVEWRCAWLERRR